MITDYLNEILHICCEEFEITRDEALSKSRKERYVYCRMAFVHTVKEKIGLNNKEIAAYIGCTHCNIHHITTKFKTSKYYDIVLRRIRRKIDELKI